jgi:hypothetical protein
MTNAYQEKKAQANAKAMIAASKARMRTNRNAPIGSSNPVGDIIAAGGPGSGKSSSLQSRTIDGIRGVTTYSDPMSMTGTVEGTTGDGRMFRTDTGGHVQTNDPFYNQGTELSPNE